MNVQKELSTIRDKQLSIYFDNLDTSKSKVWQTSEWKEKRKQLIGEECEWCGDDDPDTVFQLHHDNFTKPNYDVLWVDATDHCFVHSNDFDEELVTPRFECVSCSLTNFYSRKTKTPEYRCNNCKTKFDEPIRLGPKELANSSEQRVDYYKKDTYKPNKLSWLKKNKNIEASQKKFDELVTEKWNEYKSLKDTVTICRGCHFQHHKRGRTFCEKCNSAWHSSKYDMCWDCIVEEKNLKKCEECDEKWFNPSIYSKCKNCR